MKNEILGPVKRLVHGTKAQVVELYLAVRTFQDAEVAVGEPPQDANGAVGLMAGFDWKTTTWMAAVAVAGAVVGRRLTVILPDRVYITFIQVTLFLISIYLVGEALVSWLGRAGG